MKTLTLIFFLGYCSTLFAGDSLKVKKTFSRIPTSVLQDTAYDISRTPIDTFGFKPDFIFIARDFEGNLLESRSFSPYLIPYGKTNSWQGYGFGRDTSYAVKLDENHKGKYIIRFVDGWLKIGQDTIDFQTIINTDSLKNRTCIYEIQLGMDAYNSECIIYSTKRFKQDDITLIKEIYMGQNLYGVMEHEWVGRTKFYFDIIEQLQFPERKKNKVYCLCNTVPSNK